MTVNGSLLTIEGYGSFDQSNVNSAIGQRFVPGKNGEMIVTAPTAAELGIPANTVNTSVKVHIRVNTSRHASEMAIDFIKRGRPFIFEILVSDGFSSVDVADQLEAAFVAWETKFTMADSGLPFTWSNDGAGDLKLSLKEPYLSFQNWVGFLPAKATIDVKAVTTKIVPLYEADGTTPVTLGTATTGGETTISLSDATNVNVGDKITIGNTAEYTVTGIVSATDVTIDPAAQAHALGAAITVESVPEEARFDGKYLEENVRMSTVYTSDSYGLSPDEKPVISGEYTMITFKMKAGQGNGIDARYAPHDGMGVVAGDKTLESEMTFTLYYLEGSDNFASGGPVEELVGFLAGATAIDTFYKSNGQAATNAADFIA